MSTSLTCTFSFPPSPAVQTPRGGCVFQMSGDGAFHLTNQATAPPRVTPNYATRVILRPRAVSETREADSDVLNAHSINLAD